jgi:hypothetical protein
MVSMVAGLAEQEAATHVFDDMCLFAYCKLNALISLFPFVLADCLGFAETRSLPVPFSLLGVEIV